MREERSCLTYFWFLIVPALLPGVCKPEGIGRGLLPWSEIRFADVPASLTNLCRTLVVRPSRRSAMRRQRWTSSTTLVRRALIVRSRRSREAMTSFSLAPSAKDFNFIRLHILGADRD